MNARDPFIRAIHHRNNEGTLCRCRVKDSKARKKQLYIVRTSWEPFNTGEGNRMLKTLQSNMWRGEWWRDNSRGGPSRCRMSVAHAAPPPAASAAPPGRSPPRAATYDIAFLFHNFNTMEWLQRRRVKTMRPEVKPLGNPLYSIYCLKIKIGCKLKYVLRPFGTHEHCLCVVQASNRFCIQVQKYYWD